MNNQIKHIIEAFDFNSINKQKTPLNVSDIVIKNILNKVTIKDKTIDNFIYWYISCQRYRGIKSNNRFIYCKFW